LAFPSNQFHLQEPGENSEILNGLKYVRPGGLWEPYATMKIFGKLEVNGLNAHPMFDFLKDTCPPTNVRIGLKPYMFYNPIKTNDITWNFEKFLIDRKGRPRFRFHPGNWIHGQVLEPYIQLLLAED